jgi:hypothetical protein
VEALIQTVSGWFHSASSSKTASIPPDQHRDMVGMYKADYSPLTAEEIAYDDPECVDLFKNSTPVSR